LAQPKKKGKKKSEKAKEQKSLISYFEQEKPKTEKFVDEKATMVTKEQIEKEILGIEEIPKPTEKKGKDVIKQKEIVPKKVISREIPNNLYYKTQPTNFGLHEMSPNFKAKQKESGESAYIRFLIENGKIASNLENGVLLDVDYDGGQNKAYCKLYDLETQDIKIWIDTSGHTPYALSKLSKTDLDNNIELTNYDGFIKNETIKKVDLLIDKEIEMTKVYGKTPTNIGGRGKAIRDILGDAWEADIRYHQNYIYDLGLIPGLIYEIKDNNLIKKEFSGNSKEAERRTQELTDIFKNESEALKDFADRYIEIFNTPIIDLKRVAMDIEVNMHPDELKIPDPNSANNKVISVSFVGTDGVKKVLILEREGFSMGVKIEGTPDDLEVVFFKEERDLLIEAFRIMWKYPVLITFNGDNFDLNYLFHRSKKLKIPEELNPILMRAGFGFMRNAECNLKKGIHIDLFIFFSNRSIKGYAFSGAYERNSLDSITTALLGEGKFKHEVEIHEMSYNKLIYYNYKDSDITLELTKFNDSIVMNLITILLRMTKMPLHDLIRHQISAWIKNIFYFEHRQKDYLIPRRSEISDLKTGGYSESIINGKGFKGAIVIDPVPGIHFNVVVLDFASLYPSIIKEYNLSYETVNCHHEECKENLKKGIPYHICSKRTGIFSYVTGFFREIRVKFFKPKSSDKSIPLKQRSVYTVLQQALKVYINGSYGVFGSQNFPLFCLPVAESTTGIGRYSILSTVKKAQTLGVRVLYGDTDSVFLDNPTKEQLQEISAWSKKELDLDLEEEKTYQFLALSKRKKNYIGIYEGTKVIDVKGLTAKKSNTPDFIKKSFAQLTEILRDVTDDKEFSKSRQKIIDIIKKDRNKIGKKDGFTLEDYVISIALQRPIEKYVKTTPQHVKAAKILKAVTKKELQEGDVVSFVKTRDSEGVKPIELAKLEDIDVKAYKKLLKSAVEQILDALGISFEEIKGIKKMDSFF
jgi:DNA polymerase I